MEETQNVNVEEVIVLAKFEGEPLPENEFERIHIGAGPLPSAAVESMRNGRVISSRPYTGKTDFAGGPS